ncbi:hypothetical protein [Sorangium sp. So ce388]|uniref:hypothetical protein n=1 Tax=Sorangium sp. So ce388 TaxID=3133309 RepID=UPI003F5CA874
MAAQLRADRVASRRERPCAALAARGAWSISLQLFERARLPSAAGAARWSQAIFDEIRAPGAPGDRARRGLGRPVGVKPPSSLCI